MALEMLYKSKAINLFHILVVAPIFWLLATDKFPQEYKKYLLYLAIIIVAFHLYKLMNVSDIKRVEIIPFVEGMSNGTECGKPYVHCLEIFDSSPGYSEPLININVNDIVVWKNVGEVVHTVTSLSNNCAMNPDGVFHSGNMRPGQEFAIKFLAPGEYPYYCLYYKGLIRGKIIVN